MREIQENIDQCQSNARDRKGNIPVVTRNRWHHANRTDSVIALSQR